MKLLRLYAAIALLRGAVIVAGVTAGPDLQGDYRPRKSPNLGTSAERILLASLTGLAVCFVWVWLNGRAWR